MIAPVDPYIAAFAGAGADILTAHVEAGPHIHRTLQAIRAHDMRPGVARSEEHTSELQSRQYLVCRLLLEKKKTNRNRTKKKKTISLSP